MWELPRRGRPCVRRQLQESLRHRAQRRSVQAETLYEARALGLGLLKMDSWIEGLGPATRLDVFVREPATHHTLTVQQFQRWLRSNTSSPADVPRRAKLKALLD